MYVCDVYLIYECVNDMHVCEVCMCMCMIFVYPVYTVYAYVYRVCYIDYTV